MSLVDVYRHTTQLCENLSREGLLSQPRSIIYTSLDPKYVIIGKEIEPTKVSVLNKDTLEAAEELVKKGYKPLVLNMASNICPGGGVAKGAKAQEEDLFRRTDYYRHLSAYYYPLHPTDAILSPDVTVIKNIEYKNQKPYFKIDCLAVAGLRNPKLIRNKFKPEDEQLLRHKIRQIYQIADQHNYESLVLGALGCGAFNNPPQEVAQIFKEELENYKYCFKEIVFAVLCTRDLHNYEIFSQMFTIKP